MIKAAKLAKEINVTVSNKIGVLADMAKIVADHGINIEALAGYADGKEARIMLITEDNLRAIEALTKNSYRPGEKEVVVLDLENKPGVLKSVSAKLESEGIDIKYTYGTTCSAGCPAKLILSTSDNEKTLVAFKK